MHPVVVSVENLPAEGKVLLLEYPEAEVSRLLASAELGQVRAIGALRGEVRLMPSGRELFLLGSLRCRIGYQCVRCLEPFETDVSTDFHVVYARGEMRDAGEVELRREDLDLEVLESAALDVTRAVEEHLLVSLEPHPACGEACLGLCPKCGGNRNLSECRCEAAGADPRFAALEALRSVPRR